MHEVSSQLSWCLLIFNVKATIEVNVVLETDVDISISVRYVTKTYAEKKNAENKETPDRLRGSYPSATLGQEKIMRP